ncbi:uncharacterized protein BP01DRAFT_71166 [Aspergillus saccharolyticus JOP 1030-1]|uniref:Uncharacterized protein n=1 Tax=Aspergillus saccharolyticus JOP 1030-1 TaxID=1450539 RepID=A0A318ZRA9_9EURO|nr:hypothetical protein BP01DRAFT_71166 [Aspergillus saccharolyticus JOP 1030-1]PYH49124.1 hypothetical protein BP01DRAFT_71166 [Aspergillus saccharolyticus JOP 1030-1]
MLVRSHSTLESCLDRVSVGACPGWCVLWFNFVSYSMIILLTDLPPAVSRVSHISCSVYPMYILYSSFLSLSSCS